MNSFHLLMSLFLWPSGVSDELSCYLTSISLAFIYVLDYIMFFAIVHLCFSCHFSMLFCTESFFVWWLTANVCGVKPSKIIRLVIVVIVYSRAEKQGIDSTLS